MKPVSAAAAATAYPDAGVPVGLGHADVGVALDGSRLRLAEGGEVLHVVVDILDGEGQDLDAHAAHIRCCHLADERCELVAVLVHLFDCKSS